MSHQIYSQQNNIIDLKPTYKHFIHFECVYRFDTLILYNNAKDDARVCANIGVSRRIFRKTFNGIDSSLNTEHRTPNMSKYLTMPGNIYRTHKNVSLFFSSFHPF